MSAPSRRQQIEALLQDGGDDDGFLRYCLAMEYKSEGNEEKANEVFHALLREKPDYVPAYLQLGQLLTNLGEEEEAKSVYRQGIAIAQKQGNSHAAGEMSTFLAMLG